MIANMSEYIKLFVSTFLRIVLRIFYLFPIRNKTIVFESFAGKIIGCNPYYIYNYLLLNHPDYKYIWCYNSEYVDDPNIFCVRRNSFAYIYNLLTTSIYITNDSIPQYIPFRNRQIIINTWHGGGVYKKVGIELGDKFNWYGRLNLKRTSKSTTYFLSSSESFSNAAPKSYMISTSKLLPYGMPRNDIFFDQDKLSQIRNKIYDIYNVPSDAFLVLYAPTFRTYNFKSDLDLELVRNSIKCRFKVDNVLFFLRSHHLISHLFLGDSECQCIDVSDYPYMQDLLCAANMLISDYSSCIWDYSYTYRPCILYVPDLFMYQSETNFHTPITTWGFPFAESNEQLSDIILNFDDDWFRDSMIKHHKSLNSYEEGTATIKISHLIEQAFDD